MSVKKAQEFYRSLTAQQQHLIDKKVINDTQKVRWWLKFLALAADYDEYTDTLQKKYGGKVGGNIGLAILGLFGALFCLGAFPPLSIVFLGVMVLGIVLAVRANRLKKQMEDHDLHDSLRLLFVPLLKILMVKAGPDAKMAANLNFHDPTNASPEEYKDPRGRKVKHYRHTPIVCKVGLQDGSLLELVAADEVKLLSYWKTSASGKRKHKRKTKTTHITFVKLSVLKSAYRLKEPMPNAEISVTPTGDRLVLKYRAKEKIQAASVLGRDPVLDLLQEVYNQLEPLEGGTSVASTTRDQEVVDEYTHEQDPLPMMLWSSMYFDDYDVYGTTYHYHDYDVDDEDHVNVFDS